LAASSRRGGAYHRRGGLSTAERIYSSRGGTFHEKKSLHKEDQKGDDDTSKLINGGERKLSWASLFMRLKRNFTILGRVTLLTEKRDC